MPVQCSATGIVPQCQAGGLHQSEDGRIPAQSKREDRDGWCWGHRGLLARGCSASVSARWGTRGSGYLVACSSKEEGK